MSSACMSVVATRTWLYTEPRIPRVRVRVRVGVRVRVRVRVRARRRHRLLGAAPQPKDATDCAVAPRCGAARAAVHVPEASAGQRARLQEAILNARAVEDG